MLKLARVRQLAPQRLARSRKLGLIQIEKKFVRHIWFYPRRLAARGTIKNGEAKSKLPPRAPWYALCFKQQKQIPKEGVMKNYEKEHLGFAQFPLISWRAIFAGLIFSVICYVALTALGAAVMGATAEDVIQNMSGGGKIAMGAAVWTVLSVLLSLMFGSYFASRISNLTTSKAGGAQGVVIASLFFTLFLYGAGSAIGALGRTMGNAASAMTGGADHLLSSPAVQDTIQQSFQGLNLKSSPEIVTQGIATRLLQGDSEGAKRFLAFQAGVPVEQVDARITILQQEVRSTLQTAAQTTAKGMQAAGWTIFLTLVLGIGGCALGGSVGAAANHRQPLIDQGHAMDLKPQTV